MTSPALTIEQLLVLFPKWYVGTEAQRAACEDVPPPRSFVVTDEGNLYIGDGTRMVKDLALVGGSAQNFLIDDTSTSTSSVWSSAKTAVQNALALQATSNLADLANAANARANLGLGSAATQPTTAFDSAGTAATAQANAQASSLQKASNLSDVPSAATARANLGLGSAATSDANSFDAAGAAATAQAAAQAVSLQKVSNLSDLTNATTARTNLGLGTAATQPSSAFDAAGAAATAQTNAVALSAQKANNLSDLSSISAARSNLGAAPTWNQRTARSATAAAAYDYIFADTTTGTFSITAPVLPAGVKIGVKWTAGANPPTLTGSFNTPYLFTTLTQGTEFISDGTKWYRPFVDAPPDLSAYALSSDLANHVGQTYHSGGITYVDWNSVSWPTSRPASAGKVIVTGAFSGAGNTRPSWFQPGDLFIVPSAPVTTYLASNNFEGYNDGNSILIGQSNGSGDPFDISAGGTGATRLAQANTTGGETMVAVCTAPAGTGVTCYMGWNNTTVGQLTAVTLGTKWISPASLPPANLQLVRTRINNSGTFATAPALRINSGTGKFEVLAADGSVAWTSTTVFSAAVAWYMLELRIDCVGGHLQAFITPATGTPETVGDTTTAKSTGAHVDEFCAGVLSSLTAGTTQRFDWIRVADGATRVNQ